MRTLIHFTISAIVSAAAAVALPGPRSSSGSFWTAYRFVSFTLLINSIAYQWPPWSIICSAIMVQHGIANYIGYFRGSKPMWLECEDGRRCIVEFDGEWKNDFVSRIEITICESGLRFLYAVPGSGPGRSHLIIKKNGKFGFLRPFPPSRKWLLVDAFRLSIELYVQQRVLLGFSRIPLADSHVCDRFEEFAGKNPDQKACEAFPDILGKIAKIAERKALKGKRKAEAEKEYARVGKQGKFPDTAISAWILEKWRRKSP